jgi:hypothetical protein
MDGTEFTEETWRRVTSYRTRSNAEMLKVKPVMLAYEHDPLDENLRTCHEHDDYS